MKRLPFASTVGILCLCAHACGTPTQYRVDMQEIISPADNILSPADLDRPEKHAENGASVSVTATGHMGMSASQGLTYYETQKGILRPEKPVSMQRKEAQLGPQMTADILPAADGLLDAHVSLHTTAWESPPPKNPKNPPIDPVLRTRGIAVSVRVNPGETVRLGSLPTLILGKDGGQGTPGFRTYFLTVTPIPPASAPPAAGAAPARNYLAESQARREQFVRERNEGAAQWYFPEKEPAPKSEVDTRQIYSRERSLEVRPQSSDTSTNTLNDAPTP